MKQLVATPVLVIAVLFASGCGESGPTLADWTRQADDICAELQVEADLVRPVLFTPPVHEVLRRSSELSKKEANRLRELPLPSERRTEARDWLATLDERNTGLDLLATSVELESSDLGDNIELVGRTTQDAAEKAASLGLSICRAGVDLSVGGGGGGPVAPDQAGDGVGEQAPPGAPGVTPSIPTEFGTEDGEGFEG